MPLQVSVINRQKRVSIDIRQVREMFERLALALVENLSERKPLLLTMSDISDIALRAELNVALVSDRRIREMNRQWRGKDSATDVLSFPMAMQDDGQFCKPDAPDWFELGDIAISVERALAQAEAYGHSFERELGFLFVHGSLHVLGFDHITRVQEKEMFGRQRQILSAAGFERTVAGQPG